MKPSLMRSVVESRNAPNGVVLPPARASAPSRMSSSEPDDEDDRGEPVEEDLVPSFEEDEDRGGGTERDAARGEGVRRDPGAGEAGHRARCEAARSGRVAVLDRGCSAHGRDRTSVLAAALAPGRQAVGYAPTSGKRGPDAVVVDHAHRDQRDADAGDAVEPEVVAGRHHGEPDPGRPRDPDRLHPPAARDRAEHDADDQRVRGVQARHRGVGVGGEADEAVTVRVDEAEPEQPRRRRRHHDVADEADHVREQDRVPEAREGVVAAEVDPEHGQADDGELRVPVRPRDGRPEQVPLVDEVLERQLVEAVREAASRGRRLRGRARTRPTAACGRRRRGRAGRARRSRTRSQAGVRDPPIRAANAGARLQPPLTPLVILDAPAGDGIRRSDEKSPGLAVSQGQSRGMRASARSQGQSPGHGFRGRLSRRCSSSRPCRGRRSRPSAGRSSDRRARPRCRARPRRARRRSRRCGSAPAGRCRAPRTGT